MRNIAAWALVFATVVASVVTAQQVGVAVGLLVTPLGLLLALAVYDILQPRHAIRRNFPILGHLRYLLESIRPEINQYFIESNEDGTPFNRELRSVVYQRAKGEIDTVPFGMRHDAYAAGHEWVQHSLVPAKVDPSSLRTVVGGPRCRQPYDMSVLYVSAMSFGALSRNAIEALNAGAKAGNFAHNTGEGGVSPYHLVHGGDLIWQIGTGYFGCRNEDGSFSRERYTQVARQPAIKMIEVKLSQGAKPGLGGVLPAAKLTPELAAIRGVPLGQDVHSPPAHSAFSSPVGLLRFLDELRELSGGKPVGFKFCMGSLPQFMALCRAMVETGLAPDFITVDGAEGGTGAAPLEFTNHVGMPLEDALVHVQNCLVGFGLRGDVTVLCSGRVVTGFDIVRRLALGADACGSARAMMMALGCIQALRCNTNQCPTGVATQNPWLQRGLVVPDKAQRVAAYHRDTVKSAKAVVEAMGLSRLQDLAPEHLQRRSQDGGIERGDERFHFVQSGSFLLGEIPEPYATALRQASATSFAEATVRPAPRASGGRTPPMRRAVNA